MKYTLSGIETELLRAADETKKLIVGAAEQNFQQRLRVLAVAAGIPDGTPYAVTTHGVDGFALEWEEKNDPAGSPAAPAAGSER